MFLTYGICGVHVYVQMCLFPVNHVRNCFYSIQFCDLLKFIYIVLLFVNCINLSHSKGVKGIIQTK